MSISNIHLQGSELAQEAQRAAISTLTARLAHIALWPVRVYRARQALHQLALLDSRELRDIGLTPYDVQCAQALPLDADPTTMLAMRARERTRQAIGGRYY